MTRARPSTTMPRREGSIPTFIASLLRVELLDERSHPVEDVVEHRLQRMPQAGIRDEARVRELLDRDPEQLDPRERVGLAGQEQDRAVDRREVGDPRLGAFGLPGRVAAGS